MKTVIKQDILNYIEKNKIVKTNDLALSFSMPISTLRRYLIELEEQNFITRLFGEIIYNEKSDESEEVSSALYKIKNNVDLKRKLAKTASKFVTSKSPIYLDSGSCCYYLLEFLDKDLPIYTNSILNSSYAIKLGFKNVYIIGGKIKQTTMAIVDINNQYLNKLNFDIAFMGANGISQSEELTTYEELEGITKNKIINNSNLIITMCEKQKVNKKTFYTFCKSDKHVIVVTDLKTKPEFANKWIYITKEELE